MRKPTYFFAGFLIAVLSAAVLSPGFSAELTVKQDGSGNYQTIQAALNAAQPGDTITVYAGNYKEDLSIGNVNMPPLKKDNLTLQAAEGAEVVVEAANGVSRVQALAAAGADFGPIDYFGFFINGDNTVIDGIKFVQKTEGRNALNIATAVIVISSHVIIRNCEIEGPGTSVEGDCVGVVISPFDVISLQQGKSALAQDFRIENTRFHDVPYGFATANIPLELGLPVPSPDTHLVNCDFYDNATGIEMDDGEIIAENCHFYNNGEGVSISDDKATLRNCLIENNLETGINVDDSSIEDDEPAGSPIIAIEHCMILNNGEEANHHGLRMEHGTFTVTNTVIAGSSGFNIYFEPPSSRTITISLDHCDLYRSDTGIAVSSPDEPSNFINLTMTNSIITDDSGVFNAFPALQGTFDTNNFFVTVDPFFPDDMDLIVTNLLNVDPQYTDPANGDFTLKEGSPVATAGKNGTFLGAKGLKPAGIPQWMQN
ncbi:MAG: right-handed parallel beta-helix repeat-containing protein [bacterium]|nr:right-handed parallel beta-helix repeat-containing protein [bacterium]